MPEPHTPLAKEIFQVQGKYSIQLLDFYTGLQLPPSMSFLAMAASNNIKPCAILGNSLTPGGAAMVENEATTGCCGITMAMVYKSPPFLLKAPDSKMN